MNLKMLLFASVSLVLFASCHNSDDPYMTLVSVSAILYSVLK